ncbi:MAG: hypothetical protein CMO80_07535 [Verrucomicrobiales bacterium]|nr:hypothetical protein [Verrucomicrobiales bacterium]|tara:strand:+ start:161 stop:484 length:324 start_codon:yes stop_codon:yes gene_type:complete
MTLSFAHRKATQALNCFAECSGGRLNKMKALKLVFFAGRHHLRCSGRPVTNDTYFAMSYGPVASSCKDLAQQTGFLSEVEKEYRDQYLQPEGGLGQEGLGRMLHLDR